MPCGKQKRACLTANWVEASIKKRVVRGGKGKRGGYRTIIVYRTGIRSVFVYGFPKSAKANLSAGELDAYQKLAVGLLEPQ